MRASTWTWPPLAAAFTSEIWGGLVSSARATEATQSAASPAKIEVRIREDYQKSAREPCGWEAPASSRRRRGLLRQLHRDDLGDAGLLHGDAVERVGHLHGALVVRDHDELRSAAHLAHHLVVPAHVCLVEGGIHLVEEAEGSGLDQEDGEDQGDRGHGPLA